MPLHDPDAADPMMLVGAVIPGDEEDERAMARAIVDEYVRLGFGREELFRLFADPHFRMTHRHYQRRGPDEVRALIDDVLSEWGAPAKADRAFRPAPDAGDESLAQIRVPSRSGGSHA